MRRRARPWRQQRFVYATLAALVTSIPASAASEALPSGALEVIARVSRAAKQADYHALRSDMVREFTWSFGGDASAEQAIEEWKKRPGYLPELRKVTQARCAYRADKHVECPANAGTSYRAGFKLSEGRWKMVYFVSGD